MRQSQSLDRNFGEAYARWATPLCSEWCIRRETKPTQELLDEALAACDAALSLLDSQNDTFYSLRARILLARRELKLD